MKKGNSIVLDKPCKPYWDLPASFRASLLRQTFSTIRERVIASRLSLVAMSLYLVHYKQCGCLPALSSFDPALILVNTVRTLQFPSLKVSTLFLNMKGSFDNVNVSILCSSLKKAAVPNYAVAWIGSFPSQRTSCLLFQKSLNTFSAVQVGPQQGFPISPPMFVISVASLHIDPAQGLSLSYIDHFALSAASASYRGNVSTLQRGFREIRARARARKVGSNVPKHKLSQWRTRLQRDPAGATSPPPICLDGQIFPPLPFVIWLGYWFTSNLVSSAHFSKRLSWLAMLLLLPNLLYGADIMVSSRYMLTKMDVYWCPFSRWVSNCFTSTPIPILLAQTCIRRL